MLLKIRIPDILIDRFKSAISKAYGSKGESVQDFLEKFILTQIRQILKLSESSEAADRARRLKDREIESLGLTTEIDHEI